MMLRINLLREQSAAKRAERTQLWWALAVGVVVLEIVGCFVLYSEKEGELAAQQQANRRVETEIAQSKAKVGDHPKVLEQLELLKARETAIGELEKGRTGPTSVMLEISRLLTQGRGPSVSPEKLDQLRRENPLALFNPGWDPRRLWLVKFVEQDRTVRLEGAARDGEDVGELARRMNLSDYFSDVRLLPGKKFEDSATKLQLVQFQLEAKVHY